MPITFLAPPPEAAAALARGAARVSAAGRLQATRPVAAAAAARVLTEAEAPAGARAGAARPRALPVHFPSADDVAAGRLEPSAPVRVWRHLLSAGAGEAQAVGETLAPAAGGAHRFAAIAEGAFPAALGRTLDSLGSDAALRRRELTAAALQVNELGLRAIWLQARDGGEDVIVPLAPAPDGIEAGRRYTRAELAPRLQAALRARLAQAGPNVEF